jgi:gliding motility-associatede transport system auxiliary component
LEISQMPKAIPPSFSPRQPWTIALNVLASVLAVIAILVMANYLAARHSRRFQWSSDARFQLSPVTKEVLRSLTNQVKVIVFFDRTKPLYSLVADLLTEYRQQSPRVDLEFVDYERSVGRARAVQIEYELDPAAEGDRIVFDSGGKRRVIYAKDLSEFDYGAVLKGQEVKRTGFKGEPLFTSAIFSLMDLRPVRVYFLGGHKEHDPEAKDDQMGYLNFDREPGHAARPRRTGTGPKVPESRGPNAGLVRPELTP